MNDSWHALLTVVLFVALPYTSLLLLVCHLLVLILSLVLPLRALAVTGLHMTTSRRLLVSRSNW